MTDDNYHYVVFHPDRGFLAYNWDRKDDDEYGFYQFVPNRNHQYIILHNRRDDAQKYIDEYANPEWKSGCRILKVIIQNSFVVVEGKLT